MTHKRRDNDHASIRDQLRELGYQVYDTADLGNGFPDLLVVTRSDIAVLLEIKTGDADFTEDEKEFWMVYRGPKGVATTLESALRTLEYYDGYIMEMV